MLDEIVLRATSENESNLAFKTENNCHVLSTIEAMLGRVLVRFAKIASGCMAVSQKLITSRTGQNLQRESIFHVPCSSTGSGPGICFDAALLNQV
jgi:hypothetical protein